MSTAFLFHLRLARIYREIREAEDVGDTGLARALTALWERIYEGKA